MNNYNVFNFLKVKRPPKLQVHITVFRYCLNLKFNIILKILLLSINYKKILISEIKYIMIVIRTLNSINSKILFIFKLNKMKKSKYLNKYFEIYNHFFD